MCEKQENSQAHVAKSPWLDWAIELQFIAQAGLIYSKEDFDRERFERVREIAAEILSLQSGLPLEHVKTLFCNETGFQTPKLDTRAAIFQEDKILLVQEKSGQWALPGGWVDVIPLRLIAVQDRNKHNLPRESRNNTK